MILHPADDDYVLKNGIKYFVSCVLPNTWLQNFSSLSHSVNYRRQGRWKTSHTLWFFHRYIKVFLTTYYCLDSLISRGLDNLLNVNMCSCKDTLKSLESWLVSVCAKLAFPQWTSSSGWKHAELIIRISNTCTRAHRSNKFPSSCKCGDMYTSVIWKIISLRSPHSCHLDSTAVSIFVSVELTNTVPIHLQILYSICRYIGWIGIYWTISSTNKETPSGHEIVHGVGRVEMMTLIKIWTAKNTWWLMYATFIKFKNIFLSMSWWVAGATVVSC